MVLELPVTVFFGRELRLAQLAMKGQVENRDGSTCASFACAGGAMKDDAMESEMLF